MPSISTMPRPLGASSAVQAGEQRLRFDAASGEFRPYMRVERYVRTIPFAWLRRANRLPGRAAAVATALWFLSGVKKSATFRLTAEAVDLAGCGRKPLYRALAALEQAGLIGVQRRPGARPIVTINRPDAGTTPDNASWPERQAAAEADRCTETGAPNLENSSAQGAAGQIKKERVSDD